MLGPRNHNRGLLGVSLDENSDCMNWRRVAGAGFIGNGSLVLVNQTAGKINANVPGFVKGIILRGARA